MSVRTSPLYPVPRSFPVVVTLLLLAFLFSLMLLRTDPPPVAAWGEALRLSFIPNEGQTEPAVHYQAHGLGGTLFFTDDGVMLSLPTDNDGRYAVRLQFEGANPDATLAAETPLSGRVSYLMGSDVDAWRSGLPTYGALRYESLYAGIDLHYGGVDGRLKGTYLVAPGADPSLIGWRYDGAASVTVDTASGDLLVALPGEAGTIREAAPVAWQEINGARVAVPVHYVVSPDGSIGFALPDGYNPAMSLTLDPTIAYAQRIGGTTGDSAFNIAVDGTGAVYLAGETKSPNYPGTPGVVQTHSGGATDAFVTKLSPDGTTVVYSTYLGGTGDDVGRDIAVDDVGNAYVAGYTHSANFPTTPDAFQTTRSGYADAFVVKLNPTGTAFDYATYLGGTNYEGGNPTISLGAIAIAVDPVGRAYVTGKTWSGTSFPTQNPIQAESAGADDAFVTGLEPEGDALYFSTYFGAPLEEGGRGIAVDSEGMIYVTGDTSSSYGFPLVNPVQGTYGGPYRDAFIAKIDPVTPELVYSTYLGGAFVDMAEDIVVDDEGRATITGLTASDDFPTLFPVQPYAGDYDIFLSRLSAEGDSLEFSTYIGGSDRDEAEALAIDPEGYFYIVGSTMSDDFPVDEPVQETRGGLSDGVVLRLFPDGAVDYATYLGGASTDYGLGIAADADQNAYVTGMTRSDDFPPGAPPPGNTWDDVFVVKLEGEPGATPTPTSTATPTNTATPTVTGTPPTATPTPVCESETGFSTDVPRAILDHQTITSTLTLTSGLTIGEMQAMSITIDHTWPGDLDVDLISPAGTRVTLFHDVCSNNDWTLDNTGFDLADRAGELIGSTCPPGQAVYRPSEALAAFAGEPAAGTWTLEITDDTFSDTGTLAAWGLQASNASCTAPTPTATPSATPEGTPTATPTATATATPEAAMMLEPPSMSVMQEPGQSTEHPAMFYNMQGVPMAWTVTEAAGSCSLPSAIPWLSVSPTSGTTPGQSQSPLMVTIDTMGMTAGTHEALLCLTDDANHEIAMPISLTVMEVSNRLFLPVVTR